jgi:hypothetical protein
VAYWGDDAPTEITTDEHDTYKAAAGVCEMLETDGYGGEGKLFPISTTVIKKDEDHDLKEMIANYELCPRSSDVPQIPTYVRSHPKIGRNETCHCGSKKKHKKCCLKKS